MEPTISFAAPVASAEPAAVSLPPVDTTVPNTEFSPETPVVAPQQEPSYQDVHMYAESITSSSCDDQNNNAFDIVLNVSWTCPMTGTYNSAKVVKTVAFAKSKIMEQVAAQPIAVVESVKAKPKTDVAKLMRELAGIPGKNTFV